MSDKSLTTVLDASALLAYLYGEAGGQVVQDILVEGYVINIVNYTEVLTRLAVDGADAADVHQNLIEQGLIGGLLVVIPLTVEDAISTARLRPITKSYGLSLGDSACIASGIRLGGLVVTADRKWSELSLGVTVQLIRE